jgi:hypothetical protein
MGTPLKTIIAAALVLLALSVCAQAPCRAVSSNKEKDYGFVVPVLPDKVGDMKAFWQDVRTKNASALGDYMWSIGQSQLLEFQQNVSGRTLLVTYVKENSGLGPTFKENRKLNTPMAKYVRDQFENFIGYDFTASQNAPNVEKLWEWKDPNSTGPSKEQAVFAMPVIPGKSNDVKGLYGELGGARRDDIAQLLQGQSVSRMEAFLQHRAEGDYLVQYIESDKPISAVMEDSIMSGTPVSRFMWTKLADLTGLDLSSPVLDIHLLYDWRSQ